MVFGIHIYLRFLFAVLRLRIHARMRDDRVYQLTACLDVRLRLRRSPAWLLCLNQQYHMMGHNTLGMLMSHHVTSVLVCVQRVSVDELTVCHALIGWL